MVTPCSALPDHALADLLGAWGLSIVWLPADATIPGSYWGEGLAGIVGSVVFARGDTPVHSALHEACHWLCADATRRQSLHTNAGGEDVEEHAVCYLQCLLAEQLRGYSRAQVFADMDAWGYSFILGSAAAWFVGDVDDARRWLLANRLIDNSDCIQLSAWSAASSSAANAALASG